MADLRKLLTLISGNQCQISGPFITIKQNVRFHEGICPEKFQLNKFKMADLQPLLTFICVISGKPCQIAKSIL